jgi:signal transduction histidine kinase
MAAEPPRLRPVVHALAWTFRGSVRTRITAAAVAVVAIALLLGAIGLVTSLHAMLTREVRATATLRATEAARVLESGGDPTTSAGDEVVLQILDPTGDVVAASQNVAGRPALAALPAGESRVVDVPFDDDAYMVVAIGAGDGRTVVVGHSLDAVGESTGALTTLLAIGLPALLIVVAMTCWRAVGRALAPVDAIRTEVDAISAGQLHRRVPQPGTQDEIGRLATTMNRMLDRLEQAQTRQRRFVADASHELRSPIAAIRQHAEVALAHPDQITPGQLARTAHVESLRMQALVEDLLLLARADEHGLPLRRTPVDLDDLVLAEGQRLRVETVPGVGQRPRVDTSRVAAARVDGDPAALRRLLHNLADNAASHGHGRVGLTLGVEDGWAVVHIDDDGPGVPAAERARVFERFVRLDDARARSGGRSGLGLAIVAEIAAAHGGSVVIDDGPLGGARVTLRLPVSA